ncbi:hypothetical protein [Streptosporangium sp. NPDC023615]|uniref:hypothetical protein n=1 Tax=Streptosporangium sp. NPDC023615 TaxID=3154794 RepID=UPI00343D6C9D
MSLGLSGAVLLVVAPLTGFPAAGATVRTVLASPSEIPGCDIDPAGPCEEPTSTVTVTITEDPPQDPPQDPPAVPQKTVTSTVIVTPRKTKAPKVPKATATPRQDTVQEPPPVQQTTPPPALDPPPVMETTSPPDTAGEQEPDVQFPPNTPENTSPLPAATPTETATFDDGAAGSSVYEIRNAGSEFDGATLSRQLGIPALILVLLVLFAVLIFEGRLRRLAHAAAVRRAGPRMAGPRGEPVDPMMYPAGSAFVPAHYQSGTAYAPIISLVPMQMYGPPYPEGYVPEQYHHGYAQPTAYMPAPGYEQPGGHVDPYGRPVHGPAGPAGPVEPFGHDGSTTAFRETAPSGPRTDEKGFPPGAVVEYPGAPFPQEPPRGGTDLGGPRFPNGPRDDFRTFGSGPKDTAGTASGAPGTSGDPGGGPSAFEVPGASGDRPAAGEKPAEPTRTAAYPLQGQAGGEAGTGEGGDKEPGKKKRGLFRRSS